MMLMTILDFLGAFSNIQILIVWALQGEIALFCVITFRTCTQSTNDPVVWVFLEVSISPNLMMSQPGFVSKIDTDRVRWFLLRNHSENLIHIESEVNDIKTFSKLLTIYYVEITTMRHFSATIKDTQVSNEKRTLTSHWILVVLEGSSWWCSIFPILTG